MDNNILNLFANMMGNNMFAGNQGQQNVPPQSEQNTGAGYYPAELHTQSSQQTQAQGFTQQSSGMNYAASGAGQAQSYQSAAGQAEGYQNGMGSVLPMLLSMLSGGKGNNLAELLANATKTQQSNQTQSSDGQKSESQTPPPNDEILL